MPSYLTINKLVAPGNLKTDNYKTEQEAINRIAELVQMPSYEDAFYVVHPEYHVDYIIADFNAKTITKDTATENSVTVKRNALAGIQRLEGQVTQRRLREAHADSTWLNAQESLIATERSKLTE